MKNAWASLVGRSVLGSFLDSSLRGCGQVIFMNNPLTGLLNFIAMFWGAWAGGTSLAVAVGSVVGTLVATAAAILLGADLAQRRSGLYGFNGMLVGAAIPTFFANTALGWIVLVGASFVSTIVTVAVGNFLARWKTPGLTFPFVLTTWLVMLAAYRLVGLTITGLPQAALAVPPNAGGAWIWGVKEFSSALFTSIGQVFFVDNPISGVIFLLGLAVESLSCAGLALLGALIGVGCSVGLGADPQAIFHGLWGYSSVLTAVAVGAVFLKPSRFSLGYASLAAAVTVIIQGATATFAHTLGVPALTFPFVLATWIFLMGQPRVGEEEASN